MNAVVQPSKEIPIAGSADILIVGGGFAGISAAVNASRMGKSVILLEKHCVPGGLATLGHVCIYLPLDDGQGRKIYRGYAEEFLYETIRYSYSTLPSDWGRNVDRLAHPSGRYQTHFNIPACVLSIDELLEKNGVQVIYDSLVCDVIREGNSLSGVVVENKGGRFAYLGRMVIDASGDADVMARAGADCIEEKSIVSHWTYEIDMKHIEKAAKTKKAFDAFALRWIGLRPDADNDATTLPRYYGTTSEGVNSYIQTSRRLARDYLKQHLEPGYTMMTLPTVPQFRTTRRIRGLTDFVLDNDAHRPDSVGCVSHSLRAPSEIYEFPYGALIDPILQNTLAAGRIVAAGGEAWGLMRLIPAVVFTGQVAAFAASLAIDLGCSVQDVPLDKLQAELAKTGIMIHMDEDMRGVQGRYESEDPTAQFDEHIEVGALQYAGH